MTQTDELVEKLRQDAQSYSRASKLMAEARNAEYRARGDVDADYGWAKPEQTVSGQAADLLTSQASEIARLREALALVIYEYIEGTHEKRDVAMCEAARAALSERKTT